MDRFPAGGQPSRKGAPMLGDVLLINEHHRKAAAQIVELLERDQRAKITIAVGGESGSGKTEVAHETARLLKARGTPAKIMHIDNYYRVPPADRTPWRKEHGINSIGYSEYNWELINQNISEFLEDREEVIMPCIDLLTDQEDRLLTSFKGLRYLIIEGLYAVKAEADMRFLIDLTYHDTKKAQKVRGKEPVNDYRWQVLQREHEVMQSIRPLANYLITREFDIVPHPQAYQ
jgi:uridine kinase